MLKRMTVAALAVLAGVAGAHAQNQTEVVIQYPYPELFTETHKKIAEVFAKVRPDIKVTMRAPYESYEDGTQCVLREAVTSQMPDVSFQGLNRIRVLVDKNADAVEALEADVGHLAGDGLAQHALGAVLVGLVRRAHRYLDVGADLGEHLRDLLVSLGEQF